MLEVKALNVAYGITQVLWDASLEVKEGEIVAVIGSNGSGKSTLLKAIVGLLHPMSGSIKFLNEEISKFKTHEIAKRGVFLIPEGRSIFKTLSAHENLELGAYLPYAREKSAEYLAKVYELFPLFRKRGKQRAGDLSGGEQQMLAIGRALMSRPKLLIIDELSLGLAPIIVKSLFKTLQRINAEGITILLVEQNVKIALGISNRGYVLENNRITMEGSSEHLLKDRRIISAYLGM